MPKKYLTKSDKTFKIVNPAYALKKHRKQLEVSWLNEHRQNILSTLPKRLSVNFASYDFKESHKQKIQSIFIHGKAGTGKTVLAAYLYLEFIHDLIINRGGYSTLTHNFVIFPNFIDVLQSDFKDSDKLVDKYSKCDVLVLDDFGNKRITEYVFSLIYLVINNRYLNMLPTIITSNYSLEELGVHLEDDRIIRRIQEDYLLINKKTF